MTKGELREGYIAKWKTYPEDEIKIRVVRPHALAPSRNLLRSFMIVKKRQMSIGFSELEARRFAWDAISYEDRFQTEILSNKNATFMLGYIMGLVDSGQNVRLICYEKNPPCHRFVLIKMIEELRK